MLLSKRKSYCLPTWLKASWISAHCRPRQWPRAWAAGWPGRRCSGSGPRCSSTSPRRGPPRSCARPRWRRGGAPPRDDPRDRGRARLRDDPHALLHHLTEFRTHQLAFHVIPEARRDPQRWVRAVHERARPGMLTTCSRSWDVFSSCVERGGHGDAGAVLPDARRVLFSGCVMLGACLPMKATVRMHGGFISEGLCRHRFTSATRHRNARRAAGTSRSALNTCPVRRRNAVQGDFGNSIVNRMRRTS